MVSTKFVNTDGDKVEVIYNPISRMWHGYNEDRPFCVTQSFHNLSDAMAAAQRGDWLSLQQLGEAVR